MAKLQTVRFLTNQAPPSLIQRVHFKFFGTRQLKFHAGHFRERARFRKAPVDELTEFNRDDWVLVSVEVREDTGKFVRTAWERHINRTLWRIVIGFHDTVQTIIPVNLDAPLNSPAPPRVFYEFVEQVNAGLTAAEPPC